MQQIFVLCIILIVDWSYCKSQAKTSVGLLFILIQVQQLLCHIWLCIHFLPQNLFRTHSYEEKKEITVCILHPELSALIKKFNKTQVTRYFNTSCYKRYSWLCRCSSTSSLFCWHWTCFATLNDITNVCFNKDYADLNNFINATNLHHTSGYVSAFLTLKKFGKI